MTRTVKTYTSPYPPVPLVNRSIFTHLLGLETPGYVGHWPADQVAFVDADTGVKLTRGQLRTFALSLGYGLRHSELHAQRGEIALVYAPNSLHWPVITFGTFAAGLRITLANNAYNSHELAHQYTNSGAHLVFTTEEGLQTVRETFKEIGVSAADGDKRIIIIDSLKWAGGPEVTATKASAGLVRLEDLLSLGSLTEEEKFEGQGDETTLLCYSSGTTGKPKGVETTHSNLTSIVDIVQSSTDISTHGLVLLAILPYYHIYGCVMQMFWTLRAGITTIIQSRFEPEAYCRNIQNYKVSFSLVVPPVLVMLAKHPIVEKYDLRSLEVMISGAAPLGADLTHQVKTRLAKLGTHVSLSQGYGLTETSPTATMVPTKKATESIGSIGYLLPNLEARLVGEDGHDAKKGERGELWLRGPTVMKGYLKNPSATEECITKDRWFQTGDVAIRTKEGLYFIVDRKKELIKYKGFQVPPAELESVLLSHPDIADAAVIGVYNEAQATELPRAYIVPAKPLDEAQKAKFAKSVINWTRERVAKHKQLRGGVAVIDIIPKSAAGKILRRELRLKAEKETLPAKAKL